MGTSIYFRFLIREPFVPKLGEIYYVYFGIVPWGGAIFKGIHPALVIDISAPKTCRDGSIRFIVTVLPISHASDAMNQTTEICQLSLDDNDSTSKLYKQITQRDSGTIFYQYAKLHGTFGSIKRYKTCMNKLKMLNFINENLFSK